MGWYHSIVVRIAIQYISFDSYRAIRHIRLVASSKKQTVTKGITVKPYGCILRPVIIRVGSSGKKLDRASPPGGGLHPGCMDGFIGKLNISCQFQTKDTFQISPCTAGTVIPEFLGCWFYILIVHFHI